MEMSHLKTGLLMLTLEEMITFLSNITLPLQVEAEVLHTAKAADL